MAQGGDFINGDGSGGESIYGGKFNDEKAGLHRKFEKGIVGMANSGKNSNTSQFFITLADDCSQLQLNGNHVAFGRVILGLEVLEKLDNVGTQNGVPTLPVTITNCGII